MRQIADLHIHSKYSRATSKKMDLAEIERWCKIKGINIVGTSDFTHPFWFKELKNNLETDGSGLYTLKGSDKSVKFILSTEISCIYKKNDKTRRLHVVYFAPSLEVVEKVNAKLDAIGNIKSDGRPILGMDVKNLAEVFWEVDKDCMVIPAHAWTPWFSIFGSFSGFDSIKECYEEYTDKIFAIETGLSSDPPMNWRLSALDNITLISCSDAHSPANLGREACVFDIDENKLSYGEIKRILSTKDKEKFLYTIEFFPEEGKYHFDGHRSCNISLSPQETKKEKFICPKCKKKLTVGVMHRVDELADRKVNFKLNTIGYKSVVALQEIIAESIGKNKNTKGVQQIYFDMIKKGSNEFKILLDMSKEDLEKITTPEIVTAILKVRARQLHVEPGYDGEYGVVKIFSDKEKEKFRPNQKKLL
ncbi:endonuclease Q family protein [Patescibacteria group bacterium]|nr:endonuclease Q family protein [Patescibacteria group bacterium]